MTTTYYRHSSQSSSSSNNNSSSTSSSAASKSLLPPTVPSISSKRNSNLYSGINSGISGKYSSTGSNSNSSYYTTGSGLSSSSIRNNRYLGSTTNNSFINSNYKARSSYDLNSSTTGSSGSGSGSTLSSSYRPLSYSTYTPSSSTSKSSYSCNGSSSAASSYLNKYSGTSSTSLSSSTSSSSSSSSMGYSTTPVQLTKFNHRRSSLDLNNDSGFDSGSSSTNKSSSSSISKIPVAGLTNLGNTCYMNSVLQALYATKALRDYLINGLESGQLFTALSKLFKEMSSPSKRSGYVNPTMFRTIFIQIEKKFRSYEQQDAQEFLSYLINDLHDELNKANKFRSRGSSAINFEPKTSQEAWNHYRNLFNDSKLVDLFVGQFSSVIRCSNCGNESTCWDPFWDISLPVPRHRSRVDIEECLAEFTEAETLDGNEKPFCSKCKQPRKSTKRLSIVRSPKILVIHLKKFSNDGYKLSSDITVNQIIKIFNNSNSSSNYSNGSISISDNTKHLNGISDNETIYELYACVCHHGYSSKSGHYTAYGQYDLDSSLKKWYHFNDEQVHEVTDTFSMDTLKDAYVLFYRQQQDPSSFSTTSSSSLRYSSRL